MGKKVSFKQAYDKRVQAKGIGCGLPQNRSMADANKIFNQLTIMFLLFISFNKTQLKCFRPCIQNLELSVLGFCCHAIYRRQQVLGDFFLFY